MSNEEIRNKHKSDLRTAYPSFTLDEVKAIQDLTRKDERDTLIGKIENAIHKAMGGNIHLRDTREKLYTKLNKLRGQ